MRRYAVVLLVAAAVGGCAVPQPQNTPVQQWREIDPVTGRGFWIYVPSAYREEAPIPLIISCHGTPPYDVAEYHVREWKMLAEQNRCIVACPELIATDGLIGDGPIVGMLADEKYILSLVSILCYRYNIDRNNVMITGFSGGGFPTYWVGLRNPDIFSVVVARNCDFSQGNLAGWYPPEARRLPVYIYYGQNDPGAIVAQSKAAISYLRSEGFNVETHVIPNTGHARHPEYAMDFFRKHMRGSRPTF